MWGPSEMGILVCVKVLVFVFLNRVKLNFNYIELIQFKMKNICSVNEMGILVEPGS